MTSLPNAHGRRQHRRSRARPTGEAGAGAATNRALAWLRASTRPLEAAQRGWIQALDWEAWLAVFALLHGANAFHILLDPGDATAPVDTAIWLLLYLAVLGLFWHHYRLRWLPWLLRHQPLLCAVLAVAAASWFWSIAPEFTWKRSIHLLGTTLIAVYIGYHFAPPKLMAILFYVFAILIAGSILVALLLPEFGKHWNQDAMAWRGLTANRNHLGFYAALATLFMSIGMVSGRLPLKLGATLAAASAWTVVMTESATALVVLAVGLVSQLVFVASKRIRAPSVVTLVLLLAAAVGVGIYIAKTQYLYDFTELLGRDASFTNRVRIWSAAWNVTIDRPWLGSGYGTLWSADEGAFIPEEISGNISWIAYHAHNGFLNVTSELGLPAGVLALLYTIATLIPATLLYSRRSSSLALIAIVFIFQFIVENITESTLFVHRDLGWLLIVAVAVVVRRSVERQPAPAHRHKRKQRSSHEIVEPAMRRN